MKYETHRIRDSPVVRCVFPKASRSFSLIKPSKENLLRPFPFISEDFCTFGSFCESEL